MRFRRSRCPKTSADDRARCGRFHRCHHREGHGEGDRVVSGAGEGRVEGSAVSKLVKESLEADRSRAAFVPGPVSVLFPADLDSGAPVEGKPVLEELLVDNR